MSSTFLGNKVLWTMIAGEAPGQTGAARVDGSGQDPPACVRFRGPEEPHGPCAAMVSFLPHIVIPALVAVAFLPVGRRRALLWAPLVWVPDLDYILPSIHRAATHSALFPLALSAALVVLWRRRDPSARFAEFITRPGAPANLLLASYYLFSHEILDLFQGGVVLLWPLLNVNFYLGFQILLDTGTNTFEPAAEAGHHEGAPALSPLYPWLSTTDAAVGAFLLAFFLAWAGLRLWQLKRGTLPPRPVVVERKAFPATSGASDASSASRGSVGRPIQKE